MIAMDHRHSTPYTLLVNSSDGFEDCWSPYFTLLRRYWPDAGAPILLNTELKDWQYPGLRLSCTQVQQGENRRLTWSECLQRALARVQTPLVLYMQEDYFIDRPVHNERVLAAAAYMLQNPDVRHIGLTGIGTPGPHLPHAQTWLQTIKPRARYRISTQAALWRVDTLASYLVAEENGWMFEICGTWRARKRDETFLLLRHDAANGGPAIHYLHTGIIKGQWLREIAGVFRDNGIEVDFARRGFYTPKHPVLRKLETARRLMQHPRHMLQQALG